MTETSHWSVRGDGANTPGNHLVLLGGNLTFRTSQSCLTEKMRLWMSSELTRADDNFTVLNCLKFGVVEGIHLSTYS